MCDTVCVIGPDRVWFAKNSDRPVAEPQVVEAHAARASGGGVRTQYLVIDDPGAGAVLGSRPTWLWGFEHGVNEHRVAIGNERVWTTRDAAAAEPALIGMDLVRLGLERARSATEALEVITGLLETHGQGGIADAIDDEAYYSSFLLADPAGAWVLETAGRTWAARPVGTGAAISNRISLGTDWTRASADVPEGTDFDRYRDPEAWAAIADIRLACTLPAVTTPGAVGGPRELAALMRHHGRRPWGAPGTDPSDVDPPPDPQLGPNAEGVTVCMHVRGYQATAASMICELPTGQDRPLRAWVALGAPCASVYVPVFPPATVPDDLAREATWSRFAALRDRVEADPAALGEVRAVLGPLESALWMEADEVAGDPTGRRRWTAEVFCRIDAALASLGV